jgi:hypothetical protein
MWQLLHIQLPGDTPSITTVWYTFVQEITFHCAWQHITDWHSHPTKMKSTSSSGTICRVNVQQYLPHNMHISWMGGYLCLHITSLSVNHLWMALVGQECWNLILYIFHATDAHK